MKFALILIFLFLIFIYSCSTVTPKASTKKPAKKPEIAKKADTKTKSQKNATVPIKPKLQDTSKVVKNTYKKTVNNLISSQLESAINNFDKANDENNTEKINKSCLEIKSLAETFADGDSLKFEALFYKSECLILNQEFNESEKILSNITNDKRIPNTVLERAFIRLGQVYCALEMKIQAKAIFTKFQMLFPNSNYKYMANCEAIHN